jgi:hypothetical protein
LVRCVHQVAKILSASESRVNIEEILNAISMISLQVVPLVPHWASPQGRRAQFLEVVQLGRDAADGSALKTFSTLHPPALVRRVQLRIGSIKERAVLLFSIAEAVWKQKVQNLVSPRNGTRVNSSARLQICLGEFGGSQSFN